MSDVIGPAGRVRPRNRRLLTDRPISSRSRYRHLPIAIAIAIATLPSAAGRRQAVAAGLDVPIVWTQLPLTPPEAEPSLRGILRRDHGEGARILRRDPGQAPRVLSDGFSSAAEPDVSFDGERILFAGRRRPEDPWSIWEMPASGGAVREVARRDSDCRHPIYVSSLYTLDSPEPWYTILFVGQDPTIAEHGRFRSTSIYSVRLDGSELRRITFDPGGSFDPIQMIDSRVLFAGWQSPAHPGDPHGRVSLFEINIDGTDLALAGGRQGRRVQHMPCATSAGRIVFVEADHVGWDGAGGLASVRSRRPHHSYERLTGEDDGMFHSPSALPDGTLLVSRRGAEGRPTHGIYRFDPEHRRCEPIHDDPDWHDIHARAIVARPVPDGRSTVVKPERPTGKLYCLDAYDADPAMREHLEPGVFRRLRVVEGVPTRPGQAPRHLPDLLAADREGRAATPTVSPPRTARRLLGDVPMEPDGSFHLEIPADIPVQLQLVDGDGLAVATCRWIWVKQNERRGCIGCHEDPELTPANRFVLAARRRGHRLTLPERARRTVTFGDRVWPILTRRCATPACHGQADSPLPLANATGAPDPEAAFAAILARDGTQPGSPGRHVDPGRARTSPLVWRLLGRNASRPWDARHVPGAGAAGSFKKMPPPGAGRELPPEELQTIIEWIDLGARWGVPEATTERRAGTGS